MSVASSSVATPLDCVYTCHIVYKHRGAPSRCRAAAEGQVSPLKGSVLVRGMAERLLFESASGSNRTCSRARVFSKQTVLEPAMFLVIMVHQKHLLQFLLSYRDSIFRALKKKK